jgi:hypothetical protein
MWGVADTVRSGIRAASKRGPGYTGGGSAKAVSRAVAGGEGVYGGVLGVRQRPFLFLSYLGKRLIVLLACTNAGVGLPQPADMRFQLQAWGSRQARNTKASRWGT